METHVYLHRNGGFPNIHKDTYPAFVGNTVVEIRENKSNNIVREYDVKDIFRIDTLMNEDEE